MTLQDCRRLFAHVMDRLIAAGWITSRGFTAEKGFEVSWTAHGAQRAALLKQLVAAYALDEFDEAPRLFTAACRGELTRKDGSPIHIEEPARSFWLECLAELPLTEEGDDFLGLVNVVRSWTPEQE